MPLFQHSVLKKFLGELDKDALEAAWQKFQAHFHNAAIQQNILHAKEEEYQEGFVRDLFVNVLGYTLKPQPDYNLVLEQKSTSDATKSDGAILSPEGNVVAVIELKDSTTTDPGKVERQAFGYKHQHKDCRYVIISNFLQLRLYINDAIDFEAFDLFRLDKNSFALLYCCQQQKALHNDVPLKMKQQSVAVEENITRKLYEDYSRFKKLLFENITGQNPQYDKLLLFKKTQKLLDRFLFILFAEDRGLLPPNSVRDILSQWDQLKELDNYVPLYERFKKYFGYLNTGHKGKQQEIFAYNGGLFVADEILDNIVIDDKLLYDSCKGLSNYDFESEVDVNILGHIFEHSLNEIEEIEQQLSPPFGGDREGASPSKRKKDGVFYTPRYITKYIVENTVGALCIQKRNELNIIDEEFAPQKRKANTQQLLQKLEDYRAWLLQLTICDPACGSGAFLNQALEFLIAEHQSIDALKAKLFGDALVLSDVENSILENNLYGVDINEEAVEIAKLSLWLRTARKGRKLNSLNNNIKCGNSLISDPAVAGEKAFDWEKEFPAVFVSKRKHLLDSIDDFKEILASYKKTPEELDAIFQKMDKSNFPDLESVWGKPITSIKDYVEIFMTLVHRFEKPQMMWLGLLIRNDENTALIKEFAENNGIPIETVFQIIIENFLQDLEGNFDDYADAFSADISNGFDVVIGNPPYVDIKALPNVIVKHIFKFFKTADKRINLFSVFIERSIHILKEKGKFSFIIPSSLLTQESYKLIRELLLSKTDLNNIVRLPNESFGGGNGEVKVDTIILTFTLSSDIHNLAEVLVYKGFDRISEISSANADVHLFMPQKLWKEDENYIFRINTSNEISLLITKIEKHSNRLIDCADFSLGLTPYDKYRGHTPDQINNRSFHASYKKDETYKKLLAGNDVTRYNIRWNGQEWISYGSWLGASREERFFKEKRILIKQIIDWTAKKIWAAMTEEELYNTQNAFNLIAKPDYSTEYLLTVINSSLISFYHRKKFLEEYKDRFQKILIKDCKEFPIKKISAEQQLPFIAKADIMLSKNKELQQLKQSLLQLLQSRYEGITFSKKLQDWPGLSFSQFLKEIDKQKIKLSLSAQAEWMQYFETEKSKANAIQQIIQETDKEIDDMVYELYGLTEEERRVVEEG